MDSFPNSAVCGALADIPSLDEIRNVLSLVSGSKAGGINWRLLKFVLMSC